MNDRSLKDLLVIANELRGVYADYTKAAADGRVSLNEALALTGTVLAVLNKHGVTLAELQDLLEVVEPFLKLLPGVGR